MGGIWLLKKSPLADQEHQCHQVGDSGAEQPERKARGGLIQIASTPVPPGFPVLEGAL